MSDLRTTSDYREKLVDDSDEECNEQNISLLEEGYGPDSTAAILEPKSSSTTQWTHLVNDPNDHSLEDNIHEAGVKGVKTIKRRRKSLGKEQTIAAPHTRSNNQDTVVMMSRHAEHKGVIMMMHDTRIFYWRIRDDSLDDSEKESEARVAMLNLFLDALTTKKYRVMRTLYLVFRLTDNTMLLALVFSLFVGGSDTFSKIVYRYRLVFLVLGSEAFYTVMQFVVRIWILNRVSIYIGFFLYFLYALVFYIKGLWDSNLVRVLYGLRFLSFLLEESVDYCLDVELDRDFICQEFTAFPVLGDCLCSVDEFIGCLNSWFVCFADTFCCMKYSERGAQPIPKPKLLTLRAPMLIPNDLEYCGSVCAWTFRNTFHKKLDLTGKHKKDSMSMVLLPQRGICYAPHRCVLSTMIWAMLIISTPFITIVLLVLALLALLYGLRSMFSCICSSCLICCGRSATRTGCSFKKLSQTLICGELCNDDGF